MRARTIKAKDIPDDFIIVPSVEEEILDFLKTHKFVYSSILHKKIGRSQPTTFRVLESLARRGILKDHGVKMIVKKGETRPLKARLYERVPKK